MLTTHAREPRRDGAEEAKKAAEPPKPEAEEEKVVLGRVNSNDFVLTDSEEEGEEEEVDASGAPLRTKSGRRESREAFDELPDMPEGLLDDLGGDESAPPPSP